MAKRTVKTLNKTGRVSRKKASVTAVNLRSSLAKNAVKVTKISKDTTASGRAKISFHVDGALRDSKKSKSEQRRSA